VPIIVNQVLEHLLWQHEVVVVVLNSLQLADVRDAADGCAADPTHPLCHHIIDSKISSACSSNSR